MSTKTAPLGLRLFMEGIEIPVISAQVSANPDQPATASIQVVPTDTAMNLLARTYIDLFYLDDVDDLTPYDKTRTGPGGTTEDNSNRLSASDDKYKLLFCGELIGYSFGKDPGARQLVLQCMDLSSYWDTAYQWFADYSPDGNIFADQSANFVGADKSTFNSVSGGHQYVIGEMITTKPQSPAYRNMKGLLGGIIHVLESVAGIKYHGKEFPGFNGVNDFFTIAELRYNLLGMVGAVEKDNTSAQLYAHKAFMSWLRNGMTSLGTMLSFRDIINYVCQVIFHNIYPNPCPYYVPEAKKNTPIYQAEFFNTPGGIGIRQSILTGLGELNKAYFSHTKLSGYGDFARGVDYIKKALNVLSQAKLDAEKVKSHDTSKVCASIGKANCKCWENYQDAQSLGYKEGLVEPYPMMTVNLREAADRMNQRTIEAIKILEGDVIGVDGKSKRVGSKNVVTSTSHLYTQLILPETYWVSPPRCNVLFPDQYYQFSYSRNLMREVSRLCLTAGPGPLVDQGRGSELLNNRYYAPDIMDVEGNKFASKANKGARTLLPHELHSGIIPKFEWVTDGHRWCAKGSAKDGGVEDSTGQVKYIMRLANFNFYLHRWSARSISVGGMFNPNLVLGLPALVINNSMPSTAVIEKVQKTLGVSRWRPTQFLGKIVGLTHSITQGGGSTSVSMAYCRTHRGVDDELFGMLLKIYKNSKGANIEYPVDVYYVTTRSPQIQSDFKMITVPGITREVTTEDERNLVLAYLKGVFVAGDKVKVKGPFFDLKLLKPTRSEETTSLSRNQAAACGISNSDWDALNMAGWIKDDIAVLPLKVTFEFERKAHYVEKTSKSVALEDILMPAWYSPVWKNENISKDVYLPLLGTTDITDSIALSDTEQSAVLKNEITKSLSEEDNKKKESTAAPKGKEEVEIVPGSIEEAVDSLVVMYSLIKSKEQNVHEFIREYTRRPVASLVQILGSSDVEFDENGNVSSGSEEGFHSRAFGDYNADVRVPTREGEKLEAGKDALKGLFKGVSLSEVKSLKRKSLLNKSSGGFSVSPEMDPRGRARQRVRAYAAELSISRGLLG